MSGPIFGTSTQMGSSGGNRHLVEFRAGRMNMAGKMVHPDSRKGLVYLYQSDDQLVHFCWKDRTTGNVEDDLIIFPDDCEFKKVEQCKTGRVFLLRFKSSNRKLFFWMQEPKNDKDDEWCRRINEVMNNPPSSNSLGSGGRGGADSGDLQYMLNNLSQQQLMQLFGGVGQMGGLSNLLGSMNRSSGGSSTRNNASSPSNRTSASATPGSGSSVAATPTTVSASNAPSTPRAPKKGSTTASNQAPTTPAVGGTGGNSDNSRVLLSELQNYLAGISTAGAGSSSGSRRNVDLASSINSEALDTVISNPDYVNSLVAHLPEVEGDEDKKQQLKDTLSSPQFQQALSTFSNALQSGQLGPVVSQFQLSSEAVAAAVSGDLEQFVKALEKTLGKTEDNKKTTSDPKPDDDDEMSLG
ncbi:proteasomal ubiquitin receptor ADRM1 homolog [Culicoides brevitarsis]|uniref:proteasomal ubiquitin receptor ADRM1 homolog n=1 Tax=Culicoides brevitarsis TaxID=469753 RepID=UPI00307B716E